MQSRYEDVVGPDGQRVADVDDECIRDRLSRAPRRRRR